MLTMRTVLGVLAAMSTLAAIGATALTVRSRTGSILSKTTQRGVALIWALSAPAIFLLTVFAMLMPMQSWLEVGVLAGGVVLASAGAAVTWVVVFNVGRRMVVRGYIACGALPRDTSEEEVLSWSTRRNG